MASLLSLGRNRQEGDATTVRGWGRPFRNRSAAPSPDTAAVEMNATAPHDLEQGRTTEEATTQTAGARERRRERHRQTVRASAYLPSLPAHSTFHYNSFGAGGNNAFSALLLAPLPPSGAAVSRGARKPKSNRREREEAATLFGPNLANYFGSGNSNSGAVSGTGLTQTISLAGGGAAAAGASVPAESQEAGSLDANASRRARLGSRGRARGASLSGLSMMSLGAESVNSLGGVPAEPSADPNPAQGMMQGSTADLIGQIRNNATAHPGGITMSEGIDISTLQKWIERSNGTPAAQSTSASPVCTTLQSYVNLKRNTLKLSLKSTGTTTTTAPSDVNLLRTATSLGSTLPSASHTLFFEYDCAAPFASVQIFVRASRKHGSWLTFDLPESDAVDVNADGSPSMLAQRGPPPHVLGWPVHVAQLKNGHGSGHTAALPLDLKYFAPPRPTKGEVRIEKSASKAGTEPITPAAVAETPGFEFQRRLELDTEDAEDEAPRRGHEQRDSSVATQPDNSQAEQIGGDPPIEEEETKEQRLAREKSERETLKVAIVVEALDENARPLREPNLQTTYLRITSLPTRKTVASRLAEAASGSVSDQETRQRVWSSQVEGQEAEIGPHRFQLQELYGLSSKPPPVRAAPAGGEDADHDEDAPAGDGDGAVGDTTTTAAGTANAFLPAMDTDESNGTECLICLSSPPTTLLLPCTHGLCLECAVQLRDSVVGIRQSERRRGRTPRRKYTCPVCRRAYTSMLHLSKADEKSLAHPSQHV